jgi:hypothetical protein
MSTPSNLLPAKASWSSPRNQVVDAATVSLPLYAVATSSAFMVFDKLPMQSVIERKFDLQNKKRQRLDEGKNTEIEDEVLLNLSLDKYLSSKSDQKFYRKILVHVMVSGDDSPQVKALNDAISKFRYGDAITIRRFKLCKELVEA